MNYIDRIRAHSGHFLYYLLSSGKTVLPASVVLELTNRCNLDCDMCWWNFPDNSSKVSGELSLNEFKKLIDELATFHPRLTITGAEPFIRKDAVKVIEYIMEKGLIIECIMTNGTLMTDETAKTVAKANPRIIQFSIDGDEETHDMIRGRKGMYKKAICGINSIKNALKDILGSETKIRLNCVVLPQNIHCLNSVAELARDLGVQLQFQYLMWLDQDRIIAHEAFLKDRMGFNDNIIRNLYTELDSLDLKMLENHLANIKTFCHETRVPLFFMQLSDKEMIRKWYSDLSYVPRQKCIEPFLVSRIDAEGNVKFCPLIDYTFGNVKEAPFKTLWNHQRALKIRSLLKKERLFPGCIRCCKL